MRITRIANFTLFTEGQLHRITGFVGVEIFSMERLDLATNVVSRLLHGHNLAFPDSFGIDRELIAEGVRVASDSNCNGIILASTTPGEVVAVALDEAREQGLAVLFVKESLGEMTALDFFIPEYLQEPVPDPSRRPAGFLIPRQ